MQFVMMCKSFQVINTLIHKKKHTIYVNKHESLQQCYLLKDATAHLCKTDSFSRLNESQGKWSVNLNVGLTYKLTLG